MLSKICSASLQTSIVFFYPLVCVSFSKGISPLLLFFLYSVSFHNEIKYAENVRNLNNYYIASFVIHRQDLEDFLFLLVVHPSCFGITAGKHMSLLSPFPNSCVYFDVAQYVYCGGMFYF